VRESCMLGSERGADSNARPYRENIVQASKMPCGSPLATITRKAAAVGEASEIRIRPFRRGSGDSTHARELVRNKGSLRWT